ncbi:MAG: hypothetical protein Q9M37_05920 [Desulfonauticus sp.]|nr:hypothetical protein [Desulfonauticus sp.]
MYLLKPGDIILVLSKYLDGIEHNKFAICVAPDYFFFFYINSKPWNKARDAQVEVFGKLEISCLKHTSYIDTSVIQELPENAIREAIQSRKVWKAPLSVCKRIKEVVQESKYLSPRHKKIILDSLSRRINNY